MFNMNIRDKCVLQLNVHDFRSNVNEFEYQSIYRIHLNIHYVSLSRTKEDNISQTENDLDLSNSK